MDKVKWLEECARNFLEIGCPTPAVFEHVSVSGETLTGLEERKNEALPGQHE